MDEAGRQTQSARGLLSVANCWRAIRSKPQSIKKFKKSTKGLIVIPLVCEERKLIPNIIELLLNYFFRVFSFS